MSDEPMQNQMHQSYSSSALDLRLSTQELIDHIELTLSGFQKVYIENKETGEVTIRKVKRGTFQMNEEGTESIISFLNCNLHPAVVQGNWDDDWYRENISILHETLAFEFTRNGDKWVCEDTRAMIMTTIMGTLRAFLSRLIANEERKSYTPTMRIVENTTNNEVQQKQGFSLFKK